jgi:hypothetical protein
MSPYCQAPASRCRREVTAVPPTATIACQGWGLKSEDGDFCCRFDHYVVLSQGAFVLICICLSRDESIRLKTQVSSLRSSRSSGRILEYWPPARRELWNNRL